MNNPTNRAGAAGAPDTINRTEHESTHQPASTDTAAPSTITGHSIAGRDPHLSTLCIVLAAAGACILLVGLVIFVQRQAFATLLLDANILFGVPWSQVDAQKVAWVAAHGLVALVVGAMLLVSSIAISVLRLRRSA